MVLGKRTDQEYFASMKNLQRTDVGTLSEDPSFFRMERKDTGNYEGGTEEVVSLAMLMLKMAATDTVPPFLTHAFDELMYQSKQDLAVCALTVLSTHSQNASNIGF